MKPNGPCHRDFTVIGENVHTSRVVLRKGRRFATEGGVEGVRYVSADGAPGLLPIPDAARDTQDYREGRIKHVKIAVRAAMSGTGRDAETGLDYIRRLVQDQAGAGADFIDLNVDEISVKHDERLAAMDWIVRTVKTMTGLPISVDSSDLQTIRVGLEGYGANGARPLLNSASLERMEALDFALAHDAQVIVTSAGRKGMPADADERVANASRMVEAALEKGMAPSRLYIDPLIFPISVDKDYARHCLDAMRALRRRYGPEIHITGGMSNVSFGIPSRKLINDVFLILAVEAGADSGIIDPLMNPLDAISGMDRASPAYRLAEDVLTGADEHCANYIRAWRKGALSAA